MVTAIYGDLLSCNSICYAYFLHGLSYVKLLVTFLHILVFNLWFNECSGGFNQLFRLELRKGKK